MTNFKPNDPRLTAYALGELAPGEAAEVEALLAESADARAAVQEIRGITNQLTDRLAAEAVPALTPRQRTAIMKGTPNVTPQRQPEPAGRPGKSTVVVAACLMVLLAGALVMFHEKGKQPTKVDNVSLDGSLSMDEKLTQIDPDKAYKEAESATRSSVNLRPGDNGNGNQGAGKGGTSATKTGNNKGGPGQGQQQGQGKKHSNSPQPTPAIVAGGYIRPTGSNLSLLIRQQQQLKQLNSLTIRGGTPARWSYTSPAPNSKILGGRGTIVDVRSNLGLYFQRGRGGLRAAGVDKYAFSPDGKGVLFERERLRRLSEKKSLYDDRKYFKNDPGGKDGEKAGKPGNTTGPNKKKPPTHFKPADVAKYRKNVEAYFTQVARQLPQRELAVLRVKERVSGRLAALEEHVVRLDKAGKKMEIAKGQELVVKVLDAELGDVDLDGDGHKDFSAESYDTIVENEFLTPLADPLSTFSIDVDTASYSNVRRFLDQGQLPPRNAVRVEELINYFHYDYPQPKAKDPFSVTLESGACPWNPKHRLVMIGLKGRELSHDKRPGANLVFLIDVSGSMSASNKLPLVQLSLEMLVDQMQARDRISIVTYSNTAKVVLEPTPGDKKDEILKKIHSLRANGGTNGSAGIQMAYDQAKKAFLKKGANRVILCTDGDFNIGISKDDELVKFIQQKAKSQVFLSVFGFGMGNYKGSKLEKLADKGNGNYGYIDGFKEAKKLFIEELTGTLFTIAKDVKIQVEFNPGIVSSYRLVGYENRMLAAQDFNNDKKDAGEIGAGHTVTALYEIVPKDVAGKTKPKVDALKYQKRVKVTKDNPVSQEMLTVKLRYKQPDADKSVKIEFPLKDAAKKAVPSENFDFAASVAMYGLLLRESKYAGEANLDLVREMATGSMSKDPEGHRSEFVKLVHRTRSLVARKLGRAVPAPRAVEAGAAGAKK